MRILFLSRWYPYPPDNGSKIRVSSLLRGLCERHDVTLISFCNPAEKNADPSSTSPAPSEIRLCPYREFEPASGRALLGYLSSTPRYLVDTHNPDMERMIQQAVRKTRYDLVIASQLSMAAYYRSFQGVPAIFEEVELGIYQPGDAGDRSSMVRRSITWAKHRRFMSRLLQHFMLCTVVSDVERQILASAVPGYRAIHVVPNSVEAEPVSRRAGSRVADSLIFTGSLRFAPNHDAMTWFLNEIFPAVRAEVPGVRLTITGDAGSQPPVTDPNVVLTGQVADVRSLVAASAISLAPIRVGGGTRLKILEAMALRTPVVATTKAVEGLEARNGEHVLIADTPAEFADAVRRLLRDPAGAREMAERAWGLYRSRYDSKVVVPAFLRLVDHAAAA
jgi:polysaccharide biosynthesis protein PslH